MLNTNRAGCALALTFVAFYSVCSLVFLVSPQEYISAAAVLFHGFSFAAEPNSQSFGGFIVGLLCFGILGFLFGSVNALIWNAAGSQSPRPLKTPVSLSR